MISPSPRFPPHATKHISQQPFRRYPRNFFSGTSIHPNIATALIEWYLVDYFGGGGMIFMILTKSDPRNDTYQHLQPPI